MLLQDGSVETAVLVCDGAGLVNSGPDSLLSMYLLYFSFHELVIDHMLKMQMLYVYKVYYVVRLLDKSIGA